jgi:signal transduction histidine kinase
MRDVLTVVSHDLRTPLSVIHTTASMLLNPKYQLTPPQVREQHERIRRNVDLMNRMIGDLTDMVSMREGEFTIEATPVDVGEILREAVAAHEAQARDKGVELVHDGNTGNLTANADRARLAQLLRTLLGNAVKHSRAGGRINVAGRADGERVQVEIADTGAGIATENLARLFEPHSSSGKLKRIGTGLDLYLAKGIVRAHGGEIRCESTVGVGTRFWVTLPPAAHSTP